MSPDALCQLRGGGATVGQPPGAAAGVHVRQRNRLAALEV